MELLITASGPSEPLYANRDCSLLVFSANFQSETLSLQHSDNGTDWQASKDQNGDAVVFTANDTRRVPGGFHYRLHKSGSTASVRFALVKARGNGN